MSEKSMSERVAEIRSALEEKQDMIFAAAAPGVDPTQWTEALLQQIGSTPRLANCSLQSLAYTLRDSAELGLRIGSVLGHAYAVPRGNKAQCQVGYLGLQHLAYESPLIAGVATDTVRDGDEIAVINGTSPEIIHKHATRKRGNPIGYYAVVWLKSGPALIRYYTIHEIEEHKKKFTDGGNAWKTSFDAMARKTCLLSALKHAPLHSVKARQILQAEEHADAVEKPESFPAGTEAPADEMDAALSALNGEPEPAVAPSPEEVSDGYEEDPFRLESDVE